MMELFYKVATVFLVLFGVYQGATFAKDEYEWYKFNESRKCQLVHAPGNAKFSPDGIVYTPKVERLYVCTSPHNGAEFVVVR